LATSTIFKPAILRAADDVIRIGHVSPVTGPMAGFAEAQDWTLGGIRKLLEPGLQIAGKTYKVEIITKDSQTDESRTAEVANELILKDKVNIITAASGSIDCNPVANVAELNEVPCVTTDDPWESYYYGRNPPKEGFTWTYHFFWGLEDVIGAFLALPLAAAGGECHRHPAAGTVDGGPELPSEKRGSGSEPDVLVPRGRGTGRGHRRLERRGLRHVFRKSRQLSICQWRESHTS
jgi:branched-chain amino acid transport system substrate-binding protein